MAIGTVIAMKGRDMFGTGQKRPRDLAAKRRLAADTCRPKTCAVEGIPERKRFEPPGRGPRDLECDLIRI